MSARLSAGGGVGWWWKHYIGTIRRVKSVKVAFWKKTTEIVEIECAGWCSMRLEDFSATVVSRVVANDTDRCQKGWLGRLRPNDTAKNWASAVGEESA
jgi:hypothetical protein